MIFDEVQIGVGRSGTLFAYEQYDVVPDILTSAKGLGGGFPIGATLATEEVAKSLARGTHGTTYGGNPLACAVAGAVLDEVSRPELLANVRARSEQLFAGLHEIAPPGMFADVRGLGLLIGLELSAAFAGRAKEIQIAALGQGLIVLVAGTDVLRIAPPLNLSAADADAGLSKLAGVCAEVVDREGALVLNPTEPGLLSDVRNRVASELDRHVDQIISLAVLNSGSATSGRCRSGSERSRRRVQWRSVP